MESNNENVNISLYDSVTPINKNTNSEMETTHFEETVPLQLLHSGILETTKENIALEKEISKFLSKLDLDVNSLPVDIREGLQKVSTILRKEKLSDVDYTTLTIIMENKKVEEKRIQRENKKFELKYNNILRKFVLFQKNLDKLMIAVDSLASTCENAGKEVADSYLEHTLLHKKLNEYQQIIGKLENDLKNTHVDELYPEKILEKYNRYIETTGELANLNNSLNQYKDLPPNLLQAKAMLSTKQKEYEKLEQMFLQRTE